MTPSHTDTEDVLLSDLPWKSLASEPDSGTEEDSDAETFPFQPISECPSGQEDLEERQQDATAVCTQVAGESGAARTV
eukprot:410782-Rhodomonas_salina.2